MKLIYVQTSDGVWHVKNLHEMGLVRVGGKEQIHFPKGEHCPECEKQLGMWTKGMRQAVKGLPLP